MKKSDLKHRHAMKGLEVEMLWQDDGQWWPAEIIEVRLFSSFFWSKCSLVWGIGGRYCIWLDVEISR